MILCEQERILSAEKNLLNDPTIYMYNTVGSGGTIHDYGNITIPAGGSLVILGLDVVESEATGVAEVAIQVGSFLPVAGYKYYIVCRNHLGAAIWLAAGTYDVKVLGYVSLASMAIQIMNMQVGLCQFNDSVGSALTHYVNATNNIVLTVAARRTPIGPLNQAVFAINIGSNGNYSTDYTVTVDGVATVADELMQLPDIALLTCAKIYVPLSVGTSHTITINLNSSIVADVSVVACPWILTTSRYAHTPVTLDFPQLSTLYSILGSLFYDTTKNVSIGKNMAVSFNYSDYYASGIAETGKLQFNFSFASSLQVTVADFVVDGLGGCIESVGVDIA